MSLQVVGPPMQLELVLVNSSNEAVNVQFPDLESSFMVPPNSQRVHYLNTQSVGNHREVAYSVEALGMTASKEMDLSSIRHILSSDYVQTWSSSSQEASSVEYRPVRESRSPSPSGGMIRGFW